MGIPSIFQKFWGIENFMHLWVITIFRRKFSVSQCQKLLWASLQCFRKLEVSKNFMHNRGYHNFPSKKFCLTVPKNFVRESYCFWENFWFQKVLEMRKRVSRFSVEIFWSHSTEIFCDYPLNLLENLGYRKLFMHNRGYHNFPSKYFCLTLPKKFVGIPSMFQNNWDIEKLYAY